MELELAIGMLTLLLASRWSLQPDFVTYLEVCLQLPLSGSRKVYFIGRHNLTYSVYTIFKSIVPTVLIFTYIVII